jgi:hypothetical protein
MIKQHHRVHMHNLNKMWITIVGADSLKSLRKARKAHHKDTIAVSRLTELVNKMEHLGYEEEETYTSKRVHKK